MDPSVDNAHYSERVKLWSWRSSRLALFRQNILATASQTRPIGSLLIPNWTVYRLTSHNRIIPGIPSAAFIARLMFVEMR